jgi:hypothetical protein
VAGGTRASVPALMERVAAATPGHCHTLPLPLSSTYATGCTGCVWCGRSTRRPSERGASRASAAWQQTRRRWQWLCCTTTLRWADTGTCGCLRHTIRTNLSFASGVSRASATLQRAHHLLAVAVLRRHGEVHRGVELRQHFARRLCVVRPSTAGSGSGHVGAPQPPPHIEALRVGAWLLTIVIRMPMTRT